MRLLLLSFYDECSVGMRGRARQLESRERQLSMLVAEKTDLRILLDKFAKLTARPTGGERFLGLSIVKCMVEGVQGRVWCVSRPGAGATFVVEPPACDAAASGATDRPTT